MSNTKTVLAIKQLLANTESKVYEQANVILDNHGTTTDVEDYCKLLEHSVSQIRAQIADDARIQTLGDNIDCANYAVEHKDYNDCVSALLKCLSLVPNPLHRDSLRLRYYNALLNPSEDVDYGIMLTSLNAMVIKLNNGKPLEPLTNEPVVEEKSWKNWLPSFLRN